MPSFDVVSEVDWHEVSNAVDQANREVTTRFDFKGTDAHYVLENKVVTLTAQADFQLNQMLEILRVKLHKRGVDLAFLDVGEAQLLHKKATQAVRFEDGLSMDMGKKIVKALKTQKLKVQAQIQGEKLRVSGKKRDDLQTAIAFLKGQQADFVPMEFTNFRD